MAATIPISLSPDEQAALLAQAKAQGVSVNALIRKALLGIIHPEESSQASLLQQLAGEEFERAFEEIADLIPENVPSISSEALRRKNMYSREDEF
jgi:hypothetical protein